MILNSLMATLHHIGAFALTACLLYEFITFRKGLSVQDARRIQRVDIAFGISAGLVLIIGLLRVFFFEVKGSEFYLQNHLFWTKMGLFLIVGLLSIYPTLYFIKWNPALQNNQAPEIPDKEYKRVRMVMHLELTGILLILVAAPMMARGIGM